MTLVDPSRSNFSPPRKADLPIFATGGRTQSLQHLCSWLASIWLEFHYLSRIEKIDFCLGNSKCGFAATITWHNLFAPMLMSIYQASCKSLSCIDLIKSDSGENAGSQRTSKAWHESCAEMLRFVQKARFWRLSLLDYDFAARRVK